MHPIVRSFALTCGMKLTPIFLKDAIRGSYREGIYMNELLICCHPAEFWHKKTPYKVDFWGLELYSIWSATHWILYNHSRKFNPRTHVTPPRSIVQLLLTREIFQSRHSIRSATKYTRAYLSDAAISTHALYKKCDASTGQTLRGRN